MPAAPARVCGYGIAVAARPGPTFGTASRQHPFSPARGEAGRSVAWAR
ncbi:hypothetical protein ACKI1O_20800 [Streptomyces scabiei]